MFPVVFDFGMNTYNCNGLIVVVCSSNGLLFTITYNWFCLVLHIPVCWFVGFSFVCGVLYLQVFGLLVGFVLYCSCLCLFVLLAWWFGVYDLVWLLTLDDFVCLLCWLYFVCFGCCCFVFLLFGLLMFYLIAWCFVVLHVCFVVFVALVLLVLICFLGDCVLIVRGFWDFVCFCCATYLCLLNVAFTCIDFDV